MSECKKCGLPTKMYWCKECESNGEGTKCIDCGGKATLDKKYHMACFGLESDNYSDLTDQKLLKKHADHYDAISSQLNSEAEEVLNELLEMERELGLRENG